MTDAIAKAAAYRERAEQMVRKAEMARVEELRRSYLILARQWQRMADEQLIGASRAIPRLDAMRTSC